MFSQGRQVLTTEPTPKPEQEQPPASQEAQVDPRDAEIAQLKAEVKGLQGTADQALAGVNRILKAQETTASTERQRQQEQEFAAVTRDLPEEFRPVAEHMQRQNQALREQINSAPASPEIDPVRQQAEEIVKQYPNLDPSDARIDYTIITGATQPGTSEVGKFGAHLATLMQPAPQAPAPVSSQTQQTPPIDSGPVASGSTDADDLFERAARGEISREVWAQKTEAATGRKTGVGY